MGNNEETEMHQTTDSRQELFETQEVLAYAQAQGLKVNQHLVDYWRKQGLLGHPQVRGKGRAKGVVGLWTRQQRALLLGLLTQRQRYRVHQINLCKLPVWGWIYWRDITGISLDQVKLAMKTWAKYHEHFSLENARKDAAHIVSAIASPDALAVEKRFVKDRLTGMEYRGQYPPEEALCELFSEVTFYDHRRGAWHSHQYSAYPAKDISFLATARVTIVDALLQDTGIPNALWEWGRTFLLSLSGAAQEEQDNDTASATHGANEDLFLHETWDTTCISACYDLMTALGMGLLASTSLYAPVYDRSNTWERRNVCHAPLWKCMPSSLLMPNGIIDVQAFLRTATTNVLQRLVRLL